MAKEFYIKVYERIHGYMVAACDKEICGKTLKFNDVEVHINPRFYKDKLVSEKELINVLSEAYSANLIGKKVVGVAIKYGLVDPASVKEIDGVPHAQVVAMSL